MSNHNREVDDLDFLLRDALRGNKDAAPDAARVFAALRARVVAERQPMRTPWLLVTPTWTSSHMTASYWYLMPLARGLR
jgi:hypothetical protein